MSAVLCQCYYQALKEFHCTVSCEWPVTDPAQVQRFPHVLEAPMLAVVHLVQAAAAFTGLVNATSNGTKADGDPSTQGEASQGSGEAASDQAASTNALALSASCDFHVCQAC